MRFTHARSRDYGQTGRISSTSSQTNDEVVIVLMWPMRSSCRLPPVSTRGVKLNSGSDSENNKKKLSCTLTFMGVQSYRIFHLAHDDIHTNTPHRLHANISHSGANNLRLRRKVKANTRTLGFSYHDTVQSPPSSRTVSMTKNTNPKMPGRIV